MGPGRTYAVAREKPRCRRVVRVVFGEWPAAPIRARGETHIQWTALTPKATRVSRCLGSLRRAAIH